METIFKILLILHIIGGFTGLLTGTINLSRKKGDKNHRLVGKIFVYGMLTAGVSALALSIMHPNYFLFIIGIFTIYLVATANRYLYLKMLGSNQKPMTADWAISICMLVVGVLFVGLGVKHLIEHNNFGIVFIVFGMLGLRFVRTDFNNYKGKTSAKNYWLLAHLQRMTGAYIASATAFIVVNSKYVPGDFPSIVFWLLPTAILSPLIFSWSKKYKVEKPTT